MKVQITLTSGAQIEFEAQELDTTRDRLNGGITKMNWTTPANWTRKLHTIDVDQIVAIVCIQEPE